jgi:hypothetical protein
LVIGFILNSYRSVSTNNYDSLTEVTHSEDHCNYRAYKVFSVFYILTRRCLLTDSNNVLCFHAHVITCWRLPHNYTVYIIAPTVESQLIFVLIVPRHGLNRKHRSSVAVSKYCHANMLVREPVVHLIISRSLPSNGSNIKRN